MTRFVFCAASLAALVTVVPAFAATWTWNGANTNNSWNNSRKWSPVSPPENDGAADVIVRMEKRPYFLIQ